ncbi:2-hydroxyacid dehydrogenase [Solimicrobium silvestre]|nr:glyoxylate/hydroxypyruvate reductase A [Solimicrobium silvestre]
MNIIYCNQSSNPEVPLRAFQNALPHAKIRQWQAGDNAPADYALVWKPPVEMLAGRDDLKAIFNLGAGVDAIIKMVDQLPKQVPIIRLEDAGMGEQMADYVCHAVLHYFRRFDLFARQAQHAHWQSIAPLSKKEFTVGVLGMGTLGQSIAASLLQLKFPVIGWSNSAKQIDEIQCYSGADELPKFLAESKVIVCILPLTEQTSGILNRHTLAQLPRGAYVINVARGAHIVEQDLLELVRNGHIAGATLDVVQTEPLPGNHPFWQEPKITITPHVAALTLWDESAVQIAEKIALLEQGLPVTGVIDCVKGY